MSKGTMGVMKGLAIGMVAGAAIGAAGKMALGNQKMVKKKAGKTVRVIGDIVDSIQCMMH